MSASKHSHTSGRAFGNIFIYIDNSNLWIQGQRTYAEKNNFDVPLDPTWRFDVGRLREVLLRNSGLTADQKTFDVKVNLYGSTPPPVDTVWNAIASHGVKVNTFARSSWTRREKQVDGELILDSTDQASEAFHTQTPAVFIIVSGDLDIRGAITRITTKHRCQVHLWSWENGLARAFTREDKDIAQDLFKVHLLDDHLGEVGFHADEFRTDRAMINPHSIVVLDPLRNLDGVIWFLGKLRTPTYRYEIKPKREGASSQDLTIIPTYAPTMTNDDLRKLYMESKGRLESKGLSVLTYLEYSQKYGAGGRANKTLTISTRFKELSVQGDENGNKDDDSDGDDYHEGERDDGDSDDCHNGERDDPAEEEDKKDADDGFTNVNQRFEKQRARMRRNEEHALMRCFWRRYCSRGINCTYGHTKEEEDQFQSYGTRKPKKYKHCTNNGCIRGKNCLFAHSVEELFCPTCEKTGQHEMAACPERYPSAKKNYNN